VVTPSDHFSNILAGHKLSACCFAYLPLFNHGAWFSELHFHVSINRLHFPFCDLLPWRSNLT